jgi:hypothetical protein
MIKVYTKLIAENLRQNNIFIYMLIKYFNIGTEVFKQDVYHIT